MTSYDYIRVDGTLTVPVGTVFETRGDSLLVLVPGFKDPWVLKGEAYEAVQAFLRGTVTYPVTPNRVLDIVTGWEQKEAAREYMQGESVPMPSMVAPLVTGVTGGALGPVPVRHFGLDDEPLGPRPVPGTPRINFDKLKAKAGLRDK